MNMDIHSTDQYSQKPDIEVAVLQQAIPLPELPEDPLTLATLEAYDEIGKEYLTAQDIYTNMVGNFYIPILFPLVEDGESTELMFDAPPTKNVLNNTLATKEYVERNFVSLMIPKNLVLNFRGEIPAGTKFIVAFIGGNTSIENMSIIGIHGQSLV